MGIFDSIKKLFIPVEEEVQEFSTTVSQTYRDYATANQYFWSPDISTTTTWNKQVKGWSDQKKIRFIQFLVPRIHAFASKNKNWNHEDRETHFYNTELAYIQLLFRHKLEMNDEEAIMVGQLFLHYRPSLWTNFTHWPVGLFLNQLERQRKEQVLSSSLKELLEEIKKTLSGLQDAYGQKERIKMIEKVDGMLFTPASEGAVRPAKFLGVDSFAGMANHSLQAMPPEQQQYWFKLLPMAQKATGAKPSAKYLSETKKIIQDLGTDSFKKTVHGWLQFLVELKETEHQNTYTYENGTAYNYTTTEFITAVNADAIKGLIWICSHFYDNSTIQILSALAERAYRKIPSKGPTAASVGNACLYALYKSKGLDGIGQLSRLKLRIKQASTQAQIDKYLQAAATEQGVTVSEIEDMAVDDAGFQNGRRDFSFDEFKTSLEVTGVGKVEQRWYKPDGSLQKSVPAVVKDKHAVKFKKLKETAKQAEQTITAQRDRIDRMFREGRQMTWAAFEKYYLEHGLMSYLAKRLIWNFTITSKTESAIWMNEHWVSAKNEIVEIDKTAQISLWHPVQATIAEIKEWRDFFVFHELQQPLKQAFREVYLLTDAEINTRSYSNRMAAHLLRQHQFNSLAKARGWRYSLMGAFDNGIENDKASLLIPSAGIRAEYWIGEVNANNAMNDTGIWTYVTTDQVRFINTETSQTIDLIDVPALVFSEVMRDVDLFVGVASVGNDPTWADTGGLPPTYRDFWTSYSFGELSEIAKSRKEILTSLLPRLKIRDIAIIRDKFLVVKGKLRTYKIHIGSTNILMEPNDQYLCIVPDRSAKDHTSDVFLPFEGDNGLSIILSKAFLLAEDDKITDPTITSQINRK